MPVHRGLPPAVSLLAPMHVSSLIVRPRAAWRSPRAREARKRTAVLWGLGVLASVAAFTLAGSCVAFGEESGPTPTTTAETTDAARAHHESAVDVIGPRDEAAVTAVFEEHCFSCHGYGGEEGGLNFETLAAGGYGADTLAKWEAVWKNVRSQTMPPAGEMTPPPQWQTEAVGWVTSEVFRLDPQHIDPGRVVLRRLNREEYRGAINEVLGIHFDPSDDFPADDTGYGFDTIAEVLHLSPLLLESYFAAADEIVDEFMPYEGPLPPKKAFWGSQFQIGTKDGDRFERTDFDKAVTVVREIRVEEAGRYRIDLEMAMDECWVPTTQSMDVIWRWHESPDFESTSHELARITCSHETGGNSKPFGPSVEATLPKGQLLLSAEFVPGNADTNPLTEAGEPQRYEVRIHAATLNGPLDGGNLEYADAARWRLREGPPPPNATPEQLREHMRKQIATLARSIYRRPIDEPTLERLTDFAVERAGEPGKRYEHGVAVALKAMLSSPRFVFRRDVPLLDQAENGVAPIDEYSLATRLSFFLWTASPDGDLLDLADQGKLRDNLDEQVDRLLANPWNFDRGMKNFVGQWLQVRDVPRFEVSINFLTREPNSREAYRLFHPRLREAFAEETYLSWRYLFDENRPLEEFLNADYTFVNEPLAELYGLGKVKDVDGKPVKGYKFARVELPEGSHRGGILRQGSMLMVTSNPTRTSPVKRGLFILENILGTPAPPAPPDVPELEASEGEVADDAPLRVILEAHRNKAECAGCHSRMDPLGLALENYDPLGRWQDEVPAVPKVRGWKPAPAKAIDPAGQLLSGETFADVDELCEVLATSRRRDFYRCVTEKMLTYALGRGLTYRDATAVERIVEKVEADGGRARTLLKAIIRSDPFQKMRVEEPSATLAAGS